MLTLTPELIQTLKELEEMTPSLVKIENYLRFLEQYGRE